MDPKFIKRTITLQSYILEDLPHVKIENTYGHKNTRESTWKPNTLDHDWLQHDHLAAYVNVQ
jgi:hypothetical protein